MACFYSERTSFITSLRTNMRVSPELCPDTKKSDAARERKTHSFVPLITASYYKCFGRDKTIFSKLFYTNIM